MSQDTNTYFANRSADQTASDLLDRAKSFYNQLESNAYLQKLRAQWRFYHGSYDSDVGFGHQISFTGEQGELVSVPVNHYRNLAQHIYVMVTSNRPVMEARAINTDYKSLAQTYLANGILDYYMREKKLEDCLKKAVEMAIVLGTGYVKMAWNATAGEMHDVDDETQQPIYEGEIEFANLSPLDVVFDGTKETWDHDWIMTRTYKNRYDLIAKYPEMEDKIRKIETKEKSSGFRMAIWSNDATDDVPVYEFFHRRTESVPNGRYLLFLDSDCVLLDIDLPYRVIPVFRISPSDIIGTSYGYTPMFDIYPLQEGINSLYSTIMTNQNAFGVQNIYVPRGADISVNQLDGAMNIIEGNAVEAPGGGVPQALNLTQTPEEIFKFLEILIQSAETISGVNSVARGNPEASLKSGNALALVQSMALQFISGLQQSYVKLVEDCGTSLIQILKDYATTPKVVALVGKNNRAFLKEFTGEAISSINRVVVDVGNPLARTIAGRVQMAEQMMQMGIIQNPQQYFQVINTGRLDSMFEGEESELLLIKQENERLMEGTSVIVSPLDAHKLHIMEHKAVLADPDLRSDPTLVKAVLDHVQDHLNALRNTDPALLSLIGEQPIPPAAPMPPGGQMQGGPPPGPQGPGPDGKTNPAVLAGGPGGPAPDNTIQGPGVDNVNLPNKPKVKGSLLPNPGLQDQAMGNVK